MTNLKFVTWTVHARINLYIFSCFAFFCLAFLNGNGNSPFFSSALAEEDAQESIELEPIELDLEGLESIEESNEAEESGDLEEPKESEESKEEPDSKVQDSDFEVQPLAVEGLELVPEEESEGGESDSEAEESSKEETVEAEEKPEPEETQPAVSSPKRSTPEKEVVLLESVLPANAAIIIRVASIREFNERLEKLTETNFLKLFKTLGKGSYAKQVEPDRPFGAVLYPEQGTFQWAAFIPMKNYKKFLGLLNVNTDSFESEVPEGTISVVSPTLCIAPYRGYAVFAPSERVLKTVMRAPKFGDSCAFTPCSVKHPTLSIELTNTLIRFLTQRGRIGLEEFAPVFTPEMLEIQQESQEMELAKRFFEKATQSIAWLDQNINSARIDLSIGENDSVLSASFLPKQGTPLAEKIQDPYVPLISTRLDSRGFLKVVPTWPTPVCGQADVPPLTAEKLQAPFNRIRHVEFSLMTPPQNGRIVEGWCFFLEVNDSQEFVKELLIPRAEEVGEQFGANTLGEIGAEIAYQNAERRLERQMSRQRPPRRYANPEEAAQRGLRLGGWIGGLIGKAVAKKEVMKVQDYMGYDLYVSDLVKYARLRKKIEEQENGTAQPLMVGAQPGGLIGFLIQQVSTGEANVRLEEKLMGKMAEDPSDPPLAATRNLIVVLDPNHLLIVPGNDFVLYEAIRRWEVTRAAFLPPPPPKTQEEFDARERIPKYVPTFRVRPPRSPEELKAPWHESWKAICETIAEPTRQQLRFAAIFVPEETMKTLELASEMYDVEIPERIRETIPVELPPFLTVYTTSGFTGSTFTTIPHEMSKAQFQKLITNLPALLAQ